MDHFIRRMRDRFSEALQSRLQNLSRTSSKLRLPVWAWMIPASFLLANFAHQGSQAEGRIHWLSENSPAEEAWRDTFKRRGFSPVEDPAWREKAYAEMPESSRLKSSAYISEDHYWIALRVTGDWLYFRRGGDGKNTPGGQVVKRALWVPLGLGWEGVAKLDALELPKITFKVIEKPQKSAEWRDSRQLNF